MTVTVQLFGPLAKLAGKRLIELTIEGPLSAGKLLRQELVAREPALAPVLPRCRLAVNHAYADDKQRITAADELALIGMVSGG